LRCWSANDADRPVARLAPSEIVSRREGWSKALSLKQRSRIVTWLFRPNRLRSPCHLESNARKAKPVGTGGSCPFLGGKLDENVVALDSSTAYHPSRVSGDPTEKSPMTAGRSLQRYGGRVRERLRYAQLQVRFRCNQGPRRPAIFDDSDDTRCGIWRYETRKHPPLCLPSPLLSRNSPIQSPTSTLHFRNPTLQNSRVFPGFIDFSGDSATIRTRIQRYMARKDQGGVAESPKMPGLDDPVDSRLECYWFRR